MDWFTFFLIFIPLMIIGSNWISRLFEVLRSLSPNENRRKGEKMGKGQGLMLLGILGIAFLLFLMLIFFVAIVPAGSVGVLDTFGQVDSYVYQSGFHFKSPFTAVIPMTIKTQSYTMSIAKEESTAKTSDDTIKTLTKEGLSVDLDLSVLYRIQPEKAPEIYKNVGENYAEIIVRPQVRSVLRGVVASYSAQDIYSPERSQIEEKVLEELQNVTKDRGIVIESILLRNVQLPPQIEQAIQSKLTAEQQIAQKEFEVATAIKEAERKRQEAHGIADANAIISGSLTQDYLRWYWIQEIGKSNQTYYIPVGQDGLPLFKNI